MSEEQQTIYLSGRERILFVDDILEPEKSITDRSGRGSGRTFRQALNIILLASSNPGKLILIEDHYRNGIDERANKHLAELIQDFLHNRTHSSWFNFVTPGYGQNSHVIDILRSMGRSHGVFLQCKEPRHVKHDFAYLYQNTPPFKVIQ